MRTGASSAATTSTTCALPWRPTKSGSDGGASSERALAGGRTDRLHGRREVDRRRRARARAGRGRPRQRRAAGSAPRTFDRRGVRAPRRALVQGSGGGGRLRAARERQGRERDLARGRERALRAGEGGARAPPRGARRRGPGGGL